MRTSDKQKKTCSMGTQVDAGRHWKLARTSASLLVVAFLHLSIGEPARATAQGEPTRLETARPRTLYTCSMHPQVLREEPGPCPICGMELTPIPPARAASRPASGERKILYWWDPMMQPPFISDRPGKSPMGMELIPVYEDEVTAGEALLIEPQLRQNMGLRTAHVERGPLRKTVRAYAEVREPEGSRVDIALRVSGWIERLYATTEGMDLPEGAPMFELFSPELQAAIEEWIALQPRETSPPPQIDELLETARRRLRQLGLESAQIEAFAKLRRPPRTVTFHSPAHFHVVEKAVFEGAFVPAGTTILRLGSRQRMWIDARIYQQDLPFVREGAAAAVEVVGLPGEVLHGTISFLHPHLERGVRTAIARVEVDNPGHRLREGMSATVRLESEIAADAVLVPREAVIDTGARQIVFVDLGDGHFQPRQVRLGEASGDGRVSVLSGLVPGEQVVVSGQFLLDAESRMREAARKFLPAGSEGVSHGAHSH